ncbi:MAG: sugar-binding domain-containing protein, partial [Candidatus Acidiferrum sp.]
MDRRDFLKTTSTVLAGTTLAKGLLASGRPAAESQGGGRLVFPINRNWRYNKAFIQGAHGKDFDDSAFERVVVPHTNIRLPWHSFDDKDYEFVSIYRRRFRLPAEARGKRVFIDFEGAMTASTVWINGVSLGEYKGGYTPFSFDLTPHIDFDGENVLAVDLDSTERADIPPFGYQIDYMTFGGIYREVWLRVVPPTFIENIFAKPRAVLTERPGLDVECYLQHSEASHEEFTLEAELREGEHVLAKATQHVPSSETTTEGVAHRILFDNLKGIKLWDLEHPNLYSVHVRLLRGSEPIDQDKRTIGFRGAQFTERGFDLNGKIIKLRGLDRHQTFPFVGQAMPGRAQRSDAQILRKNLKCNIVRTSHYPQSRHFLDACYEMGLLVLEEIPGWQHIGDEAWKLISIDNVGRM